MKEIIVDSKPKDDVRIVGKITIGGCDYDVAQRGDPKKEYEVEIVGTRCDLRSEAKDSTAVIDVIFHAKRVIYTPPMKFDKENEIKV